ncbi:hypothetical protein J5N97_023048 [Dioscorea zingiberensis]|uniref:DUF7733 domain-containing protein n=1 Tax=Dioscorea zingiberensis TaxID=325984 RepID=A0A9D5HB57_9LILI|nr:hypothetical protein J5N97_023048 [Dioscorea zingiberensis]
MSSGASSAAAAAPAVSPAPSSPSFRLFRSPIHLFVLVILTVLAATGMVPASDIGFAILSIPYIYFLSVFSFPALAPGPSPSVFGDRKRNRIRATYVLVSAIIGLYLPIAYILEGVFNGDRDGIKPAARHLFLLSCQVFMEGVTFSQAFSLPVRAFVPVAYNSRRLFSIADWSRSEFAKVEQQQQGLGLRLLAGKGLVMANMAFWAFNLFGFLLPVYLPRALKRYYSIAHTSKD